MEDVTVNDLSYIVSDLRPLAVPIDSVFPDPANPMTHPEMNLTAIAGSLKKFGQRKPIVVNKNGGIIEAGNGTWTAAKQLGWTHIAAVFVEDDSTTAVGFSVSDNRTAQLSEWDWTILQRHLSNFSDPSEIPGIDKGFQSEIASKIAEAMKEKENDHGASDGSLLGLVDVSIPEPKYATDYGDVWFLTMENGIEHVLCVVDVLEDWNIWKGFLTDDTVIFCPYPGPFIPLSKRAADRKLVMVQPDPYIAGHILDRYSEIYDHESIRRFE